MGITYGDHLIDSGYYDITPEQERELEARVECPYCGTTEGLRVACDGGGYIAPDYICEVCFTGQDDGPCSDDLPAVSEESNTLRTEVKS